MTYVSTYVNIAVDAGKEGTQCLQEQADPPMIRKA
nr:MAG TPA: hypothetical protein [Caudoviricetes sp.]